MDAGNARDGRRWLALAALLHIGPLAALRAPMKVAVHEASAPPPQSFEVDLMALEPSAPSEPYVPDAKTLPPTASARTPVASVLRPRTRDASSRSAAPAPEVSVLTSPGADGLAGHDEPWSIHLEKGPDRLARRQIPLGRDSRGSESPETPGRSRTGGVAEALTEADVSRGLGRGGPVVIALEEIARTNDAPVRGVAVFEVTIDRSGKADVALASTDAEADSWARLAEAMSEAIARKHVRIPDGAAGLRIAVELDARVQLPDGQDPRTIGGFARATGLELAKDSMVVKSVPAVNVGAVGKVCSGGLHVGLDGVAIQGGCDPSNIGAVPVRIVHGRELREVPM